MDTIIEAIQFCVNYLLFYPKSSISLAGLLLIIVIIAFYVYYRRDASGKLSFIDKSRTGFIGMRLYKIEDNEKKGNWVLPLWGPMNLLLLNVKIALPEGEYEANACWRESNASMLSENLFEMKPVKEARVYNISKNVRFKIPGNKAVEFKINTSGKRLSIDSPEAAHFEYTDEKKTFPIIVTDPTLKTVGKNFEKDKKSKIWELPLIDDRVLNAQKKQTDTIRRQADNMAIRNKELEAQLNQAIARLKKME